ncbi:MBL fold metallo-hydrolase [Pseudoruegeria sp. SHC-113]|uniref:MBL fold metallo-hydrolase n=1 Tax=Pseudoruegeria sp. SHC-113 TaxID=2855439 RepID=UPI0021BB12ED|nr:MBL fold metallo-hydrolase [Pseudoruegeria sp. SHC-113]MCT8161345.1 MBL fold metallo-hydrolase [Pseudoruegeria sp. SHC-113]
MLKHLIACAAASLLGLTAASAQERRPSHCIALAESAPGIAYLQKASFLSPVEEDSLRITYVNHATFLLQTAGGLSVATDYTGYLGLVNFVPDVVTMNHAHSSHWTARPDPRIPHVLRGWGDGRTPADHHLDLGEMLIRNVPTDIRSRYESDFVETGGNSIFVFEVAGLCVGHLGHLHHEPDAAQYAALGRLDVVMAAVDGGMSLDTPTMMKVLTRLRASVVIPMHWFGRATLESFLAGMSESYAIERSAKASYTASLRTLPRQPTIVVLEPAFLLEEDF